MMKDDISIAEWALVEEIRAGLWKTLDFPRIGREVFNLNGIELVNTLFESPTQTYLNTLKHNAADQGVQMVLIMVDEEGDGGAVTRAESAQYVINHRKWIDIAHYLGCHAIRTNCWGKSGAPAGEILKWAADTYRKLLEYGSEAGIKILIENHGGVSNDPDWMVSLMKEVNHPMMGILPDWRQPGPEFDNFEFLRKSIPYARGMSYRNQPTEAETARMIALCGQEGYHGWYGIESKGREAVMEGIRLLKKYLFSE
ncbi:MAG: TIM barrel protein [Bacteroidota bacterium]|nr:TIM barrel protein [Bacteroidota bacterium]